MSQFQSWTVLIFIINIYSIFGADDPNKSVKRPWLDLNLEPQDLFEPPAPNLEKDSSRQRPRLDLNPEPEDLGEQPAETIRSDQNLETSAKIPEEGSSSDYNPARQLEMEKWFQKSGQIWNELRSDLELKDDKWKLICGKMLEKWKKPEGSLKLRFCDPSLYIIGVTGGRRMMFREMKERRKGYRSCDAPDLLSCHCSYFQSENSVIVQKEEWFTVKHYEKKKYFLLVKQPNTTNTVYWVRNIYTLKISSQAVEDKKE